MQLFMCSANILFVLHKISWKILLIILLKPSWCDFTNQSINKFLPEISKLRCELHFVICVCVSGVVYQLLLFFLKHSFNPCKNSLWDLIDLYFEWSTVSLVQYWN